MPRFRPDDHKIYNEFGAYVLSTSNRRPTPVADLMVCPQESLKYYTRMRPPRAARGWDRHDLTNPSSVRTPIPTEGRSPTRKFPDTHALCRLRSLPYSPEPEQVHVSGLLVMRSRPVESLLSLAPNPGRVS
jgi:hypothetical protein